jgi:hypothetical protein
MSAAVTRAASAVETSTPVKPSSAAMKSSATTVTSMLGEHRLRQPTERNHRDEDKNSK